MASVAARVETEAVPEPRARARRTRRRSGLTGGVAWIVIIAGLLAGVVAVNVSVLRLNVELSEVQARRATLQTENAELEARLSSSAAATRIRQLAEEAGLVPTDPAQVVYVRLPRPKR